MSRAGMKKAMMGAVIVLAGLVGLDRAGLLPGKSADAAEARSSSDSSPCSAYLRAQEHRLAEQALIAQAGAVASELEHARALWKQTRSRCVVHKTVELAEAKLRDRVLLAAKDVGFTSVTAAPVRIDAPASAEASGRPQAGKASDVHPIGVRIEIDTDRPQDIYRMIDILENLPDVSASVVQVSISGPGMPQVPTQVTATMTLRALALVGEEAL